MRLHECAHYCRLQYRVTMWLRMRRTHTPASACFSVPAPCCVHPFMHPKQQSKPPEAPSSCSPPRVHGSVCTRRPLLCYCGHQAYLRSAPVGAQPKSAQPTHLCSALCAQLLSAPSARTAHARSACSQCRDLAGRSSAALGQRLVAQALCTDHLRSPACAASTLTLLWHRHPARIGTGTQL